LTATVTGEIRTDFVTIGGQLVPIRETCRDGNRHYIYPLTGRRCLSVTSVISDTESSAFLHPWYARMGAESVIDNIGVYAQILAEHGRAAAIDLAKGEGERARALKADTGSYVHAVIEKLILWAADPTAPGGTIPLPDLPPHLRLADYDETPLPEVADYMVDGFLQFCSDFRPDFMAAEMVVFDLEEGVAGTLDMIIVLENCAISAGTGLNGEDEIVPCPGSRLVLCVDTKTGRQYKWTWKEQIAKYRRMREALMPMGDLIPMPQTHAGAVLHLRPRGEYPKGYRLMLVSGAEDQAAAASFEKARTLRLGRALGRAKPGPVIYPLHPDGSVPARRVGDLDACGYGRAPGALVKALGPDATVTDVAAFTGDELLAAKGIGDKTLPVIEKILADHGLSLAPADAAPARKAA
jgi:hypothetical protein